MFTSCNHLKTVYDSNYYNNRGREPNANKMKLWYKYSKSPNIPSKTPIPAVVYEVYRYGTGLKNCRKMQYI